jgi:hypothetical protein
MDSLNNTSPELKRAMEEATILEKVNIRVRRKTSWILLLFSLMCLIMVTFAWFTISTLANVQKLDMEIGTSPDLRISTENHGSNWDEYIKTVTGKMIDKELTDRFKTTMNDQVLDPVTSSNGKKFYSQGGTEMERNENSFLEFDLYLISNKDLDVHLTSQGEDGTNGIKGSSVSTTETGDKADVVKAVRFSFTNESNQTVIWEPNKGTAVAGQNTFDFANPMVYNSSNQICSLKKLVPQKVTVRVWFEGEDPQCVNRIQEATMSAILTFGGQQ